MEIVTEMKETGKTWINGQGRTRYLETTGNTDIERP